MKHTKHGVSSYTALATSPCPCSCILSSAPVKIGDVCLFRPQGISLPLLSLSWRHLDGPCIRCHTSSKPLSGWAVNRFVTILPLLLDSLTRAAAFAQVPCPAAVLQAIRVGAPFATEFLVQRQLHKLSYDCRRLLASHPKTRTNQVMHCAYLSFAL